MSDGIGGRLRVRARGWVGEWPIPNQCEVPEADSESGQGARGLPRDRVSEGPAPSQSEVLGVGSGSSASASANGSQCSGSVTLIMSLNDDIMELRIHK